MAWKKKIKITLTICVLLVGLIIAIRIVLMRKAMLEEAPKPISRTSIVQVANVEEGRFPMVMKYLGTLRAKISSEVSPQIMGRIVQLDVREGAWVKKGELLVKLDDRVEQAKVAEIRSKLQAAKINFHTLDGIYKRDLTLFEQKAVSQEELDLSRSRREAAKGELEALEASLKSALTNLSYTKIEAPFDGIISRRFQDPGDIAIPGRPILEIEAENAGFYVEIKVPQDDFVGLKVGQEVLISQRPSGDSFFEKAMVKAQISRLHPAIQVGTLATAEADLDERPFGLPTGSLIYAMILKGEVQGMRVPIRSLLENVSKTFCYFLDRDNRVHIREVKVLWRGEDFAILKSEGDGQTGATRVVVAQESALLRLHQGDKVTPVETERTSK